MKILGACGVTLSNRSGADFLFAECSRKPGIKRVVKIREAAERGGADHLHCEELFRSQYFCREENAELFNLAESIPGPSGEDDREDRAGIEGRRCGVNYLREALRRGCTTTLRR